MWIKIVNKTHLIFELVKQHYTSNVVRSLCLNVRCINYHLYFSQQKVILLYGFISLIDKS